MKPVMLGSHGQRCCHVTTQCTTKEQETEALIQPYGAKYRLLVWIENDMERDVMAVCSRAYFLRLFPLSAASAEKAVLFKKGQPRVLFRYAQRLLNPLGDAGTIIFLRLSAFILLCLGVQIVWDGLSELLRSLLLSTVIR